MAQIQTDILLHFSGLGQGWRTYLRVHFVFSDVIFENHAVYDVMWKTIVERGKAQVTVWRMRIVCWIPKATNTHSDCVILIAFPLQQELRKCISVLCYTYIAHLV